MVCNKPHANPTIIYENIKEIEILAVGGNLEFPILSHMLLRRDARVLTTLNINFSDSQGQLTLQSMVGFGQISNSSVLLWLS